MARLCLFAILLLLPSTALSQKITCMVTVVDLDAAPVSGAEVAVYEREEDLLVSEAQPRLLCDRQKTNKKGLVTLKLDYKRATCVMIVGRKAGYALGWDTLPYQDIASPTLNIILDKPVVFAGRVVDDKGRPVADASVRAQPKISKMQRLEQSPVVGPVEWMTTRTDADGRFQWDCFGADVRADFLVAAPGSKTVHKFTPYYLSSCGYEAGYDNICLTFPKQVAVRGQVVDDKGNGISAMTVVIRPDHRGKDFRIDYVPLSSVTDNDGRFCFDGVPPANHFLKVLNTDLSKLWVDKTVIVNAADAHAREAVVIPLKTGGVLDVTLLDESTQKPIEKLTLIFSQAPANKNEWWFNRDVETNAAGNVKVMLPAGDCKFRFWDDRYRRDEDLKLPIIETGKSAAVRFNLMPQKRLDGVVQGPDGKPAANVSVKMTWGQKVLTDSAGAFQCAYDRLREDLCFIARDMKNNRAVVLPIGDPQVPATLTLKDARTLRGSVVDPDGGPIAAARVNLDFDGPGYLSDCSREILTDASGRFEFQAIPSEMPEGFSFRVSVTTMNHGSRTYQKLDIQDETKDLLLLNPISMSPANQTLDGVVLDEENRPVAALPILLHGKGQYGHSTVTDKNGRFQLQRLCEGEIRLQAGIGGEDFKPGRVTAHSGDTDVKIFMGQDRVHVMEVSLMGRSIPDGSSIGLTPNWAEKFKNKPLLICFWDYQQRPSRHRVNELVSMKETLEKQGVEVVLVHSAPMGDKAKEWINQKGTSFQIGSLPRESEKIRAQWGVKSLPWLILTDVEHHVTAEGFSVEELERKLNKAP